MAVMSRIPKTGPRRLARALALPLVAAAFVPAAAEARIAELGQTAQQPAPSCPSKPCLAVSKTTGYQKRIGSARNPFVVPDQGRIVAWSITLGAPTAKQVRFFNTTLGGAPSAHITILRRKKKGFLKVVNESPVHTLTPYLGETVQYPLVSSIPVKEGDVVALTVPTWVPALAVGAGEDTSWRASRQKGECDDTSRQTAQDDLNDKVRYECKYTTARLSYTATFITSPKPPDEDDR
jgi:hypothetical protein